MEVRYLVRNAKESWKVQKILFNKGYRWDSYTSNALGICPDLPAFIPIGKYGTIICNYIGLFLLTFIEINKKEGIENTKDATMKIKLSI